MSRQYDQATMYRFEHHGVEYELVEPENLEELVEAFRIRDVIQEGLDELMRDEDSSAYENLLEEQNDFINGYLERLGDFDGTRLAANISAKAKQSGLRMGDLEEMLELSAGYISRTGNEKSGKRLGIDVVWKASKILEVGLGELVESDLSNKDKDTTIVYDFIRKLSSETHAGHIDWVNIGGADTRKPLHDKYHRLDIFQIEGGYTRYHPDHLPADQLYRISKGIRVFKDFIADKDLLIIPYLKNGSKDTQGYDFILVWTEGEEMKWEKVFYSDQDPGLKLKIDCLFMEISESEKELKLTPKMRATLANYLN